MKFHLVFLMFFVNAHDELIEVCNMVLNFRHIPSMYTQKRNELVEKFNSVDYLKCNECEQLIYRELSDAIVDTFQYCASEQKKEDEKKRMIEYYSSLCFILANQNEIMRLPSNWCIFTVDSNNKANELIDYIKNIFFSYESRVLLLRSSSCFQEMQKIKDFILRRRYSIC